MNSVRLIFDGLEVTRIVAETYDTDIDTERSHIETRMPIHCDRSDIGIYSKGEYYTITIKRHRKDDNEWDDK